jgi:hypothetical protein
MAAPRRVVEVAISGGGVGIPLPWLSRRRRRTTRKLRRVGVDSMARLGERAVVIGASMGGLLAARALTEFYGAVTVIERDELPAGCGPRKGVPQARHAGPIGPIAFAERRSAAGVIGRRHVDGDHRPDVGGDQVVGLARHAGDRSPVPKPHPRVDGRACPHAVGANRHDANLRKAAQQPALPR